jgi:p24 family protein delta-1
MRLIINLVTFSFCAYLTNAIMFHVNPNTQKCLRDEMQADQLIAGEYEITSAPGQKIDYVVSAVLIWPTISRH